MTAVDRDVSINAPVDPVVGAGKADVGEAGRGTVTVEGGAGGGGAVEGDAVEGGAGGGGAVGGGVGEGAFDEGAFDERAAGEGDAGDEGGVGGGGRSSTGAGGGERGDGEVAAAAGASIPDAAGSGRGGGGRDDGLGDFGDAAAAGGRRRHSRVPVISAIVVGCVVALLVAVLATSKSATNPADTVVKSPLQDKPAPPISGPDLQGGKASLSSYRGKWVLVNFFASWCVPCQQEQNDLVKFQNAHSAGDAVIFGVRFDDPDVGPIEQMMSKSGAKWPIVDDPDAKIDYGVTGPPESFLVSPGGIVLVHIIGPTTEPQLQTLLEEAQLVVTTPAPTTTPASTPALANP